MTPPSSHLAIAFLEAVLTLTPPVSVPAAFAPFETPPETESAVSGPAGLAGGPYAEPVRRPGVEHATLMAAYRGSPKGSPTATSCS
jgi:hypothetical protein